MNIGRITKEQLIKSQKKISREIELQNSVGWSFFIKYLLKDFKRKPKYKQDYSMGKIKTSSYINSEV
jgi:hypothetical protein